MTLELNFYIRIHFTIFLDFYVLYFLVFFDAAFNIAN